MLNAHPANYTVKQRKVFKKSPQNGNFMPYASAKLLLCSTQIENANVYESKNKKNA